MASLSSYRIPPFISLCVSECVCVCVCVCVCHCVCACVCMYIIVFPAWYLCKCVQSTCMYTSIILVHVFIGQNLSERERERERERAHGSCTIIIIALMDYAMKECEQ